MDYPFVASDRRASEGFVGERVVPEIGMPFQIYNADDLCRDLTF